MTTHELNVKGTFFPQLRAGISSWKNNQCHVEIQMACILIFAQGHCIFKQSSSQVGQSCKDVLSFSSFSWSFISQSTITFYLRIHTLQSQVTAYFQKSILSTSKLNSGPDFFFLTKAFYSKGVIFFSCQEQDANFIF